MCIAIAQADVGRDAVDGGAVVLNAPRGKFAFTDLVVTGWRRKLGKTGAIMVRGADQQPSLKCGCLKSM